jgi:putative spermidine/putrescine transport system substrate-binding protein
MVSIFMIIMRYLVLLFVSCILASCGNAPNEGNSDVSNKSWEQITSDAKGQTLTMMMWQGDPLINKYMTDYVVPQVKSRYNIQLNIVGGQGNAIVSALMSEMEAGKENSELDMMWINGETFFQLREIQALHGPFVEQLPNNKFLNWENEFISTDFQQTVNGMECPWGNVQMAWIYDSTRVQQPPMNMAELAEWVKAHPGKFTIPNEFTGMTLLKAWLIELSGSKDGLKGPFNEAKYKELSTRLWAYINDLKPYMWNEGKSFPAGVSQLHQLLVSGEVEFSLSNNDAEVDNKILQGIFPKTFKAYVPSGGTIQNSHYLGIVNRSAHKEAAMVLCNFMISPETQFEKMKPDVWGDATVLNIDKLEDDWKQQFNNIPGRVNAPKRSDIQQYAVMEPAAEYMIRLFEDFRKEVIEN